MHMRSKAILMAVFSAAALLALGTGNVGAATGAGKPVPVVHGIYADANGMTRLIFDNDRVKITTLGIMQGIFKYSVLGKEITVSGANNGQSMLLEIDDQGCILGVPGTAKLCKSENAAEAGAKAAGVSGVYVSSKPGKDGFRFDFHADRTVEMSGQGISLSAHYVVAGKKVTITAPESAGGETMALQINDHGCLVGPDVGELCRAQASGNTGLDARSSAAGIWRTYAGNMPQAGSVRYVFHNDGTVVMSARGASLSATYRMAGQKVTITEPKAAGGESFVLQIDDKDCLYSPEKPTGPRLCRQ